MKYFSEAFREVGKDWGNHIVAALIFIAVTSLLGFTWIGGFLAGGVMIGYFYYVRQKIKEGKADFSDIFIALKKQELLLPSILAGIVSGIIVSIGTFFCIIPGIVAAAAFLFTYLIILDGELDFWKAMMKSKDIVAKNWVEYCIFTVLTILLVAVGCIVIIGVIFTLPVGITAIILFYEDIKKNEAAGVAQNII